MGVLRLCATPLRRLRGPVVGEHRGVPLDRLPLSRTFFSCEVASLPSLIASSIDCCELGCALLVPTSRGYVWSDKSVMPPDEEAFE